MRIVKIKKFTEEVDEFGWLIEGLLPDIPGFTLLYARQGIGKTTFCVQMCDALQRGDQFLEMQTKKTRFIYVQVDSSEVEWREMTRRICPKSEGFTMVRMAMKAMDNPTYVQAIAHLFAQYQPGFVVFDSLYALTAKTINTEAVLQPIETMNALCNEIPWLVIHHCPQDDLRAAGHHSLPARCSNEWALTKNKLIVRKARLIKNKEIALQKNDDGLWELYKRSNGSNNVYNFG